MNADRLKRYLADLLTGWAEKLRQSIPSATAGEPMADKPDPQASFASLGDAAPAHWVELVRSRAPHLLDGRGSLRSSPVTHQARNETAGAGNPERPKLETAVRPARGEKSVMSEPDDESYRTDEMER
ncbi:MAG: hypothetical protein WBM40_02065, partial [Thiohalocapsa sp.]